MNVPPIPQVTLEEFEKEYGGRHLVHAAVDYWAARKPDEAAIVNATRGTQLTWRELQRGSVALAGELWRMGFRKGDFLAASLPLGNEHILLEYACFRLGVIHAPLDLRLEPAEAIRCLGLIGAKGYFFLGKAPRADFAALGERVRERCGRARAQVDHVGRGVLRLLCPVGGGDRGDQGHGQGGLAGNPQASAQPRG